MKKTKLRREKEKKTDYRKRLKLLKSEKPRLVVRRTNKNYIVEIVAYEPQGDKILAHATGSELGKFGWNFSNRNLPAAYLTGLLCGLRAMKKVGNSEAVADFGLNPSTKGSGLYAALKGALDAGVKIPHNEGILPSDDRISGKHVADFAESLRNSDVEKYNRVFSDYIKKNLDPSKIAERFGNAKKAIIESAK